MQLGSGKDEVPECAFEKVLERLCGVWEERRGWVRAVEVLSDGEGVGDVGVGCGVVDEGDTVERGAVPISERGDVVFLVERLDVWTFDPFGFVGDVLEVEAVSCEGCGVGICQLY